MVDNHRVQQVIDRAETLVEQLDETVLELINLLRHYSESHNGEPNDRTEP